ncbi:Amidohydro_3 domain-containing protein [Pseudozyma hubeiensis]|nr:Amidohydro_3 domain-containing protein [Pseudozyma hubeiensis]
MPSPEKPADASNSGDKGSGYVVLQPSNTSSSRTGRAGRQFFVVVAVASLVLSVYSLATSKSNLHLRSSQFTSLPSRYAICSADHRGELDLSPTTHTATSIFTGDEQRFADHQGFTQCVAVDDGVIVDVGSEEDVLPKFCGHHERPTTSGPASNQQWRAPRSNKAARLNRHAKGRKGGVLRRQDKCAVRRLRRGQTLFPGFHDAHGHILDYGWSRTVANLVGSTSVRDVVDRLEDYVRSRPHLMAFALADETEAAANASSIPWIEGIGWDQTKWTPAEFPTAADLDRSTLLRRFPIVLRRIDVHALWLSGKGLDKVASGAKGFPTSPKDDHKVQGGLVIRGPDDEPTGVLIDNAMNFAYQVIPEWTDEKRKDFLNAATEGLLRVGITAVGDAATDLKAAAFYKRMDAEGQLRFRIYSMLACPPDERRCAHRIEQIKPVSGLANPTEGKESMFTLRAVKLFNDGALGSWGSAMWEDYSDKPGERGLLLIPEHELPSLVEYWLTRGWQVCTHAIGDRANTLTLDAYEKYLASHSGVDRRTLRPRVEHAQLMRPSDIDRFASLGVIASMQPTHCTSDMGYVESRIGAARASNGAYAWKSLLAANASLALGSDFPVELPDPLHGIYSAITRLDPRGDSPHGSGGWFPHEKLTRREALRGFTKDAAFAQFEEDVAGSIEVGRRADFTLLDRNILDEVKVSPATLRSAKVDATFVGGKVAFDRYAAAHAGVTSSKPTGSAFADRLAERLQRLWTLVFIRASGPSFDSTSTLWAALLLGGLFLLLRSSDKEAYESLSCLALNTQPPTTAWMNMGFWTPQLARSQLDFPLACQTLAQELYTEARVRPGLKVLDVGCGAGQSTLFLLEEYKPKVLHAVTSLPQEAAFAAQRLQWRSQSGDNKDFEGTHVKVWGEDVLEWLRSGKGDGEKYDVILALDCAFHFSDRAEYIRLATKRLSPGGRLAFVDLLSAYPAPSTTPSMNLDLGSPAYPKQTPSLVQRVKHSFTCALASTKPANLWPVDRYFDILRKEGGFDDKNIRMRDISVSVFPGFARFLRSFATEGAAWRGGGWAMRKGLGAFSSVVQGWSEECGLVRMFIVVAQKDGEREAGGSS